MGLSEIAAAAAKLLEWGTKVYNYFRSEQDPFENLQATVKRVGEEVVSKLTVELERLQRQEHIASGMEAAYTAVDEAHSLSVLTPEERLAAVASEVFQTAETASRTAVTQLGMDAQGNRISAEALTLQEATLVFFAMQIRMSVLSLLSEASEPCAKMLADEKADFASYMQAALPHLRELEEGVKSTWIVLRPTMHIVRRPPHYIPVEAPDGGQELVVFGEVVAHFNKNQGSQAASKLKAARNGYHPMEDIERAVTNWG